MLAQPVQITRVSVQVAPAVVGLSAWRIRLPGRGNDPAVAGVAIEVYLAIGVSGQPGIAPAVHSSAVVGLQDGPATLLQRELNPAISEHGTRIADNRVSTRIWRRQHWQRSRAGFDLGLVIHGCRRRDRDRR